MFNTNVALVFYHTAKNAVTGKSSGPAGRLFWHRVVGSGTSAIHKRIIWFTTGHIMVSLDAGWILVRCLAANFKGVDVL